MKIYVVKSSYALKHTLEMAFTSFKEAEEYVNTKKAEDQEVINRYEAIKADYEIDNYEAEEYEGQYSELFYDFVRAQLTRYQIREVNLNGRV